MSRSKKGKTVAIDMTVGIDEGVGLPSAPGTMAESLGPRRSGFGDARGGSSLRQPTASDSSRDWRGERTKRGDRERSTRFGGSSSRTGGGGDGDRSRSGGMGSGGGSFESRSSRFGDRRSNDRSMGGSSGPGWRGGGPRSEPRERRQPGSRMGYKQGTFSGPLSSGAPSGSSSSGMSRGSGPLLGSRPASTTASGPSLLSSSSSSSSSTSVKKSKFAMASKGSLGAKVASKPAAARGVAKKSSGRWGQLNGPPTSTYSTRDREDRKGGRIGGLDSRIAKSTGGSGSSKKTSPSPPTATSRSSSKKGSPAGSPASSSRKGKGESAKSAESAKRGTVKATAVSGSASGSGGKGKGSVSGSGSASAKKAAAKVAQPEAPPPLDPKKALKKFNKLCKSGVKVEDPRLIEAGLKPGRLDAFNAEQFGRCMAVTLTEESCPGLSLYKVLSLCEEHVPTALLELCLETISCLEQSCTVLSVAQMCGNIPIDNESIMEEYGEEEDPLSDMVFDSAIYLDESNIVEGFFRLQKSFESPEVLQEFVEYGLQYLYPVPIDRTNGMLALMRDNDPRLTTIRLGEFLQLKSQFADEDDSDEEERDEDADQETDEQKQHEEAEFFMNLPNFIALCQFVLRKEYFENGQMLRLELDAKRRVIEEERRMRDDDDDDEASMDADPNGGGSSSSVGSGIAANSEEEELLNDFDRMKKGDVNLSKKASLISAKTIEKLSKKYGSRINVPKKEVLNIFKTAKLNASFGEEYGIEENGNAYSVFLIYICVVESYKFSGKLHRGLVALLRDLFDARLISFYDLNVWRLDKSATVAGEMGEGKKQALFVLSELIFDLQMRQEKRRQEESGSESDEPDDEGDSADGARY